MCPREKGFVLWGHCQNLLDDPRSKQDIGDEFHYLLICPFFQTDRYSLIKSYFYCRPNVLKFKALLTSTNEKTLSNLSKFVKIIIKILIKKLSLPKETFSYLCVCIVECYCDSLFTMCITFFFRLFQMYSSC